MANAAEKRALHLRKEVLENDHNANTDEELSDEDMEKQRIGFKLSNVLS